MKDKYLKNKEENLAMVKDDYTMTYGSADAIRLQGINVQPADSSSRKKTLNAIDDARKGKDITHCNSYEEYLELFSAKNSVKHLMEFEEQFMSGTVEGLEEEEFVSQMKSQFSWLTD